MNLIATRDTLFAYYSWLQRSTNAIVIFLFRYNALVFIDECHATGFLGKTGRGTDEYCGVKGRVDIINSTLGKALGGAAGGYTSGSKQLIDLLRQRARPYLFSNSLPPPVVACASQVKSYTNRYSL